MAKPSDTPLEISPSGAQWEATIKNCTSIFTPSTFGIRVQQLSRLGGYDIASDEASDLRDLADALFALGSVATGETACIKISAVPSCVWVAAYADYIMGMRVHMESETGSILWMNYSEVKGGAQIVVTVDTLKPEGRATIASQSISRTILVQGGENLICQTLGLPADHTPLFIGGRVHWDSMLQELFGEEASVFRSPLEESECSRDTEELDDLEQQHLPKSYHLEWFAEMIVATVCHAVKSPHL